MSSTTITVPFPAKLNDDEQFLEEELIDYFNGLANEGGELGGPLLAVLNLDVSDGRVEVNLVEIHEVDVDDAGVTLRYSYEYNGYAACKDIDLSGDDHGTAFGKRVGDTWVFEVYVSPEPLAPNEEF